MGYAIMQGPCWVCKVIFAFNPLRVPSIRDGQGEKQPVCRRCIERANLKRRRLGLPPHEIHPSAYSPIDESEMPGS